MASLLSDFLTALGVRHTRGYSDARFAAMPFQSMFGLTNLLREYGVGAIGINVAPESRAEAFGSLPTPFLADTPDGFVIVLSCDGTTATYLSQSRSFTASVAELTRAWTGVALLARSTPASAEPDYRSHSLAELANGAKAYVLAALVIALVAVAMWSSGLCGRWSAWLLLVLDCAGLWFSWSLVQKSLGIHTAAADAVCSALEEGGCDSIARSEASSFFGIFKWSEVGLAYFSVSLTALLLFPSTLPTLAAINILCLPYTLWSIWYQRFKARTWCTLCVSVQATLWLLFATYLLGGWTGRIFPVSAPLLLHIVILGCTYAAALLGLNRLDSALARYLKTSGND